MFTRAQLLQASCRHQTERASDAQLHDALAVLGDWTVVNSDFQREFRLADYHQTMAFVNAVAEIAHREDHHPELVVGYNRCTVRYNTHSVGGFSENDFICAAKVDEMYLKGPWQSTKA
jgi:4a-hydroxytetrahydrobiopterin dehydratase